MKRTDGIAETIADFLSERKLELSKEDLDELAEAIDHGCQMHDEVSYGHIPNPMIAEVEKVKQYRKDDEREHDKEVERLRGVIEDWKREVRRLENRIYDLQAELRRAR